MLRSLMRTAAVVCSGLFVAICGLAVNANAQTPSDPQSERIVAFLETWGARFKNIEATFDYRSKRAGRDESQLGTVKWMRLMEQERIEVDPRAKPEGDEKDVKSQSASYFFDGDMTIWFDPDKRSAVFRPGRSFLPSMLFSPLDMLLMRTSKETEIPKLLAKTVGDISQDDKDCLGFSFSLDGEGPPYQALLRFNNGVGMLPKSFEFSDHEGNVCEFRFADYVKVDGVQFPSNMSYRVRSTKPTERVLFEVEFLLRKAEVGGVTPDEIRLTLPKGTYVNDMLAKESYQVE